MENILGFDFEVFGDYVDIGMTSTLYLDSEDFAVLKAKFPDVRVVKIENDKPMINRRFLLDAMRLHDFDKYLRMIDNATDNYFDSVKVVPSGLSAPQTRWWW